MHFGFQTHVPRMMQFRGFFDFERHILPHELAGRLALIENQCKRLTSPSTSRLSKVVSQLMCAL